MNNLCYLSQFFHNSELEIMQQSLIELISSWMWFFPFPYPHSHYLSCLFLHLYQVPFSFWSYLFLIAIPSSLNNDLSTSFLALFLFVWLQTFCFCYLISFAKSNSVRFLAVLTWSLHFLTCNTYLSLLICPFSLFLVGSLLALSILFEMVIKPVSSGTLCLECKF